jgi:hypothetical protein
MTALNKAGLSMWIGCGNHQGYLLHDRYIFPSTQRPVYEHHFKEHPIRVSSTLDLIQPLCALMLDYLC